MPETQSPYILGETGDFAVVFKPPRMHCAPLQEVGPLQAGEPPQPTLLDWYAAAFPPVMEPCGRKKAEGGLLHRLDFETSGLVLFAKNQGALDHLLAQQTRGNFVKEYTAVCRKAPALPPSFPPPPAICLFGQGGFDIESFFRPFGPGRKQVRPVVDAPHRRSARSETAQDQGRPYRTKILGVSDKAPCDDLPDHLRFTARLRRGFRHQVRCHLAWIGYPILNDPLYSQNTPEGTLALTADALSFDDPESGCRREYRIPATTLQA